MSTLTEKLKQSLNETPRVKLLQGLSPAVSEGKGRPGQLLLPDGVAVDSAEVIPVNWREVYVAFKFEGDKPKFVFKTEDAADPKLADFNGLKKEKQDYTEKHEEWDVIINGDFSQTALLDIKGTSMVAHRALVAEILQGGNEDISKYVFKLSGAKPEGKPYQVLKVEKLRETSAEEKKQIGDIEVPF